MPKPLYDAILKYVESFPERFHMPGHFGVDSDGAIYESAKYDITELPFSDNLQAPSGLILESEKNAAKAYDVSATLYFTNGATSAMFVALSALTKRGDKVIVQRACHKSVYSAIRFLGLKPCYISASFNNGLPELVKEDTLARAIEKNPDAKAVVLTSPDYFGRALDPRRIKKIMASSNMSLVVDGAHGAHFAFSGELPENFSGVADIEIVSFHKTLPVYSGGAGLNVKNEGLADKCRALRADLHTTSPCYLTLASIDYAIDEFSRLGEVLYERLKNRIIKFKANLQNKYVFLNNGDFSRIVIKLGRALYERLYRLNIVAEAYINGWAVFIVSPLNMERLDVLEGLLFSETPDVAEETEFYFPTPIEGRRGEGFEMVDAKDAAGRTAYNEIGVYPPGIPLVAHGEIITTEILDILAKNDTFGFINGKICVII